jgi:molecular chaperone GrpE
MVNKKHNDTAQDDVEITSEDTDTHEPELEELEEKQDSFNNTLRDKLKACETEKREILEEAQRTKADFLNARKRLEEERKRDRERSTISHIEDLIPLCDSFQVAMGNKEVWEKADANWRKGIEGINAQLQNILAQNQVRSINPVGEAFNPHAHEALSTAPVTDKKAHDTVVAVIQMGYELTRGDGTTELIRPARVVIGEFTEQ